MRYLLNIALFSLLLGGSTAYGQITEDPEDRRGDGKQPLRTQTPEGRPLPFKERLRFGGGITGLRFGNPFSLGAAPVLAYQATERLITGLGVSYTYTRQKAPYYVPATYNQYSGRAFVMYELIPEIIPNLYAHGEIENSTIQIKVDQGGSLSQQITAPLLGFTYMQPISRRFGFNLTALYNLNYDANSYVSSAVYGSPLVIRVSFF